MTKKMASRQWHSRERHYEEELELCRPERMTVDYGDYHPLKVIIVTESRFKKIGHKESTSSSSSSCSSISNVDPLSGILDGTDPLSMFAATAQQVSTSTDTSGKKCEKEEYLGSDFEPWSSKRGEILARYTTSEKLSIANLLHQDLQFQKK